MDLKIAINVGTCKLTNLPLQAQFERIEVGENGAVDIKYVVHTLDLFGGIHKQGTTIHNIQYFPYPLNKGGEIIETPLTPAFQALLENLTDNIQAIMEEKLLSHGEEDQV